MIEELFSSLFHSNLFSPKGKIKVTTHPQYTKYFWGDISEIAGKDLSVLDRNKEGDCLCVVKDRGLVDVDHRDIIPR